MKFLFAPIVVLALLSWPCARGEPKGAQRTEAVYHSLAMTPPMGWNSWNVFQGNIHEEKIRGIADALAASGMRDAGYKYMVVQNGKTYLSDLYYVWRSGPAAPRYNSNSEGQPIVIGGTPYQRGLGFKGRCQAMFKLNGKAHRFKAVIGLDAACQSDDSCRFKVRNLDPISPTSLLYDSGKMTRDTAPSTVDVDVSGVDCLILECESKKALGNWAEAYVVVD